MLDPEDRLPSLSRRSRMTLLSQEQVSQAIEEKAKPEADDLPGEDMKNPVAQLYESFPRIANRVIEFWGKPDLRDYLTSLTLMDRIDRAGFPEEAMECLLAIWRFIQDVDDDELADNPWIADVRLTKSFKQEEIDRSKGFRYRTSSLNGKDAAVLDIADFRKMAKQAPAAKVALD